MRNNLMHVFFWQYDSKDKGNNNKKGKREGKITMNIYVIILSTQDSYTKTEN